MTLTDDDFLKIQKIVPLLPSDYHKKSNTSPNPTSKDSKMPTTNSNPNTDPLANVNEFAYFDENPSESPFLDTDSDSTQSAYFGADPDDTDPELTYQNRVIYDLTDLIHEYLAFASIEELQTLITNIV